MFSTRVFLTGLAIFCGLAAAAIAVGNSLGMAAGSFDFSSFHAIAALSFTVLGGLVVSQRPANSVGWVFVLIGLSSLLVVVSASFDSYRLAAWVEQWSFPLAFGLLPFALLRFPDGHLPSRAWRPVGWAAALGLTVAVLFLAHAAWDAPGLLLALSAPMPASAEADLRIAAAGLLLVLLSMAAAVGSLVVRWYSADGETRQQLKVLALAASVVPVGLLLDFTLGIDGIWHSVAVAVPAAAAVAILKYRLYEIVDLVCNRSLVYGVLTVLVIGMYTGLVALLTPLVGAGTGPTTPLMATVITAVVFDPVRRRVQRGVNRLLYGDRDEPYAVIARLSRRLEQAADPCAVLPRVAETVADALRLPYAAIELGDDDARLVACHGRLVAEPHPFPMTYQGRVVGRLLVSPRSAAQPFTPVERSLLGNLATQAGLAAHAIQLTCDLQGSRERLVRSREEERRRLRRELHDGLGPALAGMTMQVGAARALLTTQRERVDEALREVEHQLQSCVVEVRRVVDDLRPSTLDQLGLVQAIKHRVAAFDTPGQSRLQIAVTADDGLGELPAAVEVAAYRVVTEAVTNTVRHAGASRCDVTLRAQDVLVVEVTDDGIGLPTHHQNGGIGLATMRERAEELGGTLTAGRLPGGGTRVRAELPLAAP